MEDEPRVKVTFTPEPTADERDAVVAALAVLLLAGDPAPVESQAPTSRWARVGRLETMGGIERRSDRGWGRTRA